VTKLFLILVACILVLVSFACSGGTNPGANSTSAAPAKIANTNINSTGNMALDAEILQIQQDSEKLKKELEDANRKVEQAKPELENLNKQIEKTGKEIEETNRRIQKLK
jgi:peptidoglycan hydrolase CwlO-like protein